MLKKHLKLFTALRIALVVVFVSIIGTIAGILGGLISPQIFLPEDIIQLRPIIFEDKTASRVVEKNIDITELVRAVAPSIGELYRVASKNTPKDIGGDVLPFAKDFLGYAIVGSADGWILLPPSVAHIKTGDIRFIDSEKHILKFTTRIEDPATGLQYAHVTLPADTTLRPVQVDTTVDIGASKRVYKLLTPRAGASFELTPLEYPTAQTMPDASQLSSVLQKRFNAQEAFYREGIPFVTEKKEVIGIATAQGILPMAYVQDAFTQVLRAQKIQRPLLNLQYLDLSLLATGLSVSKRNFIKNGAYILAQKRPSILRGPQGDVTFIQGDIITNINNESLDTAKSLSEMIQQYKKGDILTLEYFHAGEKKTGQVTLQ